MNPRPVSRPLTFPLLVVLFSLVGFASSSRAAAPLITEVMYHPPGTNVLEEWFEIFNPGTATLDLSGWRVSRGVRLTFPPGTTLPAGRYLAVAANAEAFAQRHPHVTSVVAGWSGMLSDDGDTLEIRDHHDNPVTQLTYAPDGDWAVRRLAPPDSRNRRGWEWYAPHDGGGSSLELINPALPASAPGNWAPSTTPHGTPAAPNSVAASDIAPLISDLRHQPALPGSADAIRIAARVRDERPGPLAVQLRWRASPATEFTAVLMTDDGAQGDGLAGDTYFGAQIPPQPDGAVIEFQILAADATGHLRTYPAFEPTSEPRSPYPAFQIDDAAASAAVGAQPVLRLILPPQEKAYLEDQIWGSQPNSDAQVNGTVISQDHLASVEGPVLVRYLCGIRNRGHGTRTTVPHNFRINLPRDRPLAGRSGLNLNSYYTLSQVLGSAVFRALGIPSAESRLIQLRFNGVNLAQPGAPQWGSYAANELLNGAFVERLFPDDPDGNLYRGIRDVVPDSDADLTWHGPDPAGYTNAYFKQNNLQANDWSDLIRLVATLDPPPETPAPAPVEHVVNLPQWMRYFAINTLLDNQETCLGTGVGDDFAMFRGEHDTRFQLLPFDHDSIAGRGLNTTATRTSLFKMADLDVLDRLVKDPAIAPLYYRQLRALADGFFAPEHFDPFLDQLATSWEGTPAIHDALQNMKAYNASRVAFVRSQIPASLSANTTLPTQDGYLHTTNPTVALSGQADATRTAAIRVNGLPTTYAPWLGEWSVPSADLRPGLNSLLVEAFDPDGSRIAHTRLDVWYDTGATTPAPATIADNSVWTAAKGPYLISSTLTVADGASLTIEAGTTLYLASGANVTVANGGRVHAEGTPSAPIRFTRPPGTSANWGGLTINGAPGSPETRLAYVHFEFNGSTAIHVNGGAVLLDHLSFGNTDRQYLSLDDASFVVRHCHFPSGTSAFELVHGTGGIRPGGRGLFVRNFFGTTIGYNDVVDFTGGNRPDQPIVQFVDNVFLGSSDDALDIDGTDAWVADNLFLHVHRNGAPDSSAAVSGGDSSGRTSEITLLRNVFFDCDNAATAKEGNFFTLLDNTILHITREGGVDFDAGVVNVRDTTPDVTEPGRGFYLQGNVIADVERLVRNPTPEAPVTLVNNLIPEPWEGPGSGNRVGDPLFVHTPTVAEATFDSWEAAQQMRAWLSFRPGSPARAAEPGSPNLGADRPAGIRLNRVPTGTNRLASATLTVGPFVPPTALPQDGFPEGSGYIAYQWRLDAGPWSADVPGDAPLVLNDLPPGPHQVQVRGKNDAGFYQDDPAWDSAASLTTSPTWWVDPTSPEPPARPTIEIHEVLASNVTLTHQGASTPDLVELHNYGQQPVDLAGLSLTDAPENPRRFVFPAPLVLEPGGYLVIEADNATDPSGLQLGFNLRAAGDRLLLFDDAARGGALLDEVAFGPQVPDLSIGRGPDHHWALGHPTPGEPNQPIPTGDPAQLRINEWLASPGPFATSDFIELFNTGDRPVALEDLNVSDAPGSLARQPFPPLSFIPALGYLRLFADGDPSLGGDHLGFRLGAQGGSLFLTDASGQILDAVLYGPQRTGISQGRSPDGGPVFLSLTAPTPAGPNPGFAPSECPVITETLPLLPLTALWRYGQTADLDGVPWTAADFDDSLWPAGPALLGVESCNCLPSPGLQTQLELGRITYYFRTQFVVDTDLSGFSLELTTVLDDGAILYLNGTELLRVGMPSGATTAETRASRNTSNARAESFSLALEPLVPGTNTLAVEVHQTSSSSSDMVWGAALHATRTATNCAAIARTPVRLNEVLVRNQSFLDDDGLAAPWIEIANPSTNAAPLAGLSLSTDATAAGRWTFPNEAILPPQGFLTLACDPGRPPSDLNTGLLLSDRGGSIFLFDRAETGGGLIDALQFGLQAADLAVGRPPEEEATWTLTLPTPNAPNVPADLGNPAAVRVNEWMADPNGGADWLELFNSDSRPVALAGLFLSDNLNAPFIAPLPPLSFLGTGANAYRQFFADGAPAQDPSHLPFRLDKNGEALAVHFANGTLVDAVDFGPQDTGISQGRLPDGTANFASFPGSASPNAANHLSTSLDTDRDGIPDAWELAHGLDPFNPADASLDPDADGLDNRTEYYAGTDPRDPASLVGFVAIVPHVDRVTLRFSAALGRRYTVEFASDLENGPWSNLGSPLAPTNPGLLEVTDTQPPSEPRFYRLRVDWP